MLKVDFEAPNKNTKKENVRPDVIQITIAEEKKTGVRFCFQNFTNINRLCNSDKTERSISL